MSIDKKPSQYNRRVLFGVMFFMETVIFYVVNSQAQYGIHLRHSALSVIHLIVLGRTVFIFVPNLLSYERPMSHVCYPIYVDGLSPINGYRI